MSGRARISVPTGSGTMFLGAKLLELARTHPGIMLTVTLNNQIEDLTAAEADVAIRITTTPPLDYVAGNICTIDWNLPEQRKAELQGTRLKIQEIRFRWTD